MIVQRPSPESETRPANFDSDGSSSSAVAVRSSSHEAIDAAAPPHLGDVAEVEVVLVVRGIAQRRRLGVDGVRLLADVGGAQDVHALGVGGHEAVLDAVVHHLDEVPGAVRPAVQVALLGGAARPARGRACGGCRRCPARASRRADRDAARSPVRRRSSCSSRARGPRRRRWCRRRRSGCPSAASSFARRMSST